jgi:hypothetical protein
MTSERSEGLLSQTFFRFARHPASNIIFLHSNWR